MSQREGLISNSADSSTLYPQFEPFITPKIRSVGQGNRISAIPGSALERRGPKLRIKLSRKRPVASVIIAQFLVFNFRSPSGNKELLMEMEQHFEVPSSEDALKQFQDTLFLTQVRPIATLPEEWLGSESPVAKDSGISARDASVVLMLLTYSRLREP